MNKKQFKPIISLDFDGVIHSYRSGWKGAANIPDEPFIGAIEAIIEYLKHYRVAIFSSRSHQWGGKRAMKKWLKKWLVVWFNEKSKRIEESGGFQNVLDFYNEVGFMPGMDLWDVEIEDWAGMIIGRIEWPWFKPSALITIDDRAVKFTGIFPSIDEIKNFKPWYEI